MHFTHCLCPMCAQVESVELSHIPVLSFSSLAATAILVAVSQHLSAVLLAQWSRTAGTADSLPGGQQATQGLQLPAPDWRLQVRDAAADWLDAVGAHRHRRHCSRLLRIKPGPYSECCI